MCKNYYIFIKTPSGLYRIKTIDVAIARANAVHEELGSECDYKEVLKYGIENPNSLITWLMTYSSWSEWLNKSVRVGESRGGDNFWNDVNNFGFAEVIKKVLACV